MKRFTIPDTQWRERLERVGLVDASRCLDGEPPDGTAHVAAEPLGKEGLGGRKRWRWRVTVPGASEFVAYAKRYARTPLSVQWDRIRRQSMFHSAAWCEFQQSQRLWEAHVSAVRAIAYAEEMLGPFERRSAVILDSAPGDAFDRTWERMTRAGDERTRGARRHDVTRRLARFVAAFHQTGLRHRDLYLCHVFVDFSAHADGRPDFHLIDLARVFRPLGWTRSRWTIKDLSQLDVSARAIGATRADRLRFLLAYLALQRAGLRVRRLAQRVAAKADSIAARDARKRRM